MSNILDFITEKIPSFFKGEESKFKRGSDEKTLDDVKHNHELIINKIVTDIINFFMENKNKDEYILELLDPTVCNDLTLFFSKELTSKFTEYKIDRLKNNISVSKDKHKPCTTKDSCTKQIKSTIVSDNPQITKWELCYTIASHYVKMLNLLAAILTGISPERNMCIERMNSIYYVVEEPDGTQGFQINICKTSSKKAVKDRLFEENGLRELINLYILDHMDKVNTDDDIKAIDIEYKRLVKVLNDSRLLVKPIQIKEESTRTPTEEIVKPSVVVPEIQIEDKIKDLESKVKQANEMASTIKLPVQIADNLNYLKEKSSQLTALVEKKNATPQAVTSVLENYSSKSSRTSSSEFESETTSESSNESSDSSQIIIIIDDAYDTLSEIKSKSSTNSSSKSQEYNNSESSSENTNYYNNSSNSELDEDNQAGGAYDDKDDSLTKFNNFIKKYKEYWTPEVRNYFDSLINNAFNSGSVADVCNAANVSNKDIFIDSADIYENASLQDFLSNFNEMKLDYIDYCDKLISILENELLETTKEKRTIRYSFRKLSVDELHDLQKKCRRTLLEMYTSNHEYYLKGIGYLKRYFTSTFYKKSQANKK